MTALAVTGLKREARIVSGEGIVTLACGGHGAVLKDKIEHAVAGQACAASSASASAVDSRPMRSPGDIVVASEVRGGRTNASPSMSHWTAHLLARLPKAAHAPLAGSGSIIGTASAKAALFQKTGAYAVDMESHIVAELSLEEHGIALCRFARHCRFG